MNCDIAPLSCNYHMRQSTLRIESLIHWILPCGLYTTSYRSVFATCLRNAYAITICANPPCESNLSYTGFCHAVCTLHRIARCSPLAYATLTASRSASRCPNRQNKGANAFAPAPLSQVEDGPWMKMVPELRLFGIESSPRIETVWHLRTLTGRAPYTPAERPARSRYSTPHRRSKRPWQTTPGPQAFPRTKAPVAWAQWPPRP